MSLELALASRLDTPISPQGPSVAWCTASLEIAPRFAQPFAIDPAGLWFDQAAIPCFGFWNGIEAGRRARMAAQVRLARMRDAEDFVVELLPLEDRTRIAVARIQGARTLGEAGVRIAEALGRPGLLGRLLGRDRLGPEDGLRLPILRAGGRIGQVGLTLDLGADGPEEPVPERITLGRADVYRRQVQCGGPFVVWAGDRRTLEPLGIAWIHRPVVSAFVGQAP